jgi:hypothetical protein
VIESEAAGIAWLWVEVTEDQARDLAGGTMQPDVLERMKEAAGRIVESLDLGLPGIRERKDLQEHEQTARYREHREFEPFDGAEVRPGSVHADPSADVEGDGAVQRMRNRSSRPVQQVLGMSVEESSAGRDVEFQTARGTPEN